jgi:hypothetical protein
MYSKFIFKKILDKKDPYSFAKASAHTSSPLPAHSGLPTNELKNNRNGLFL